MTSPIVSEFNIPERVGSCIALDVIEEFSRATNNRRNYEHPVRVAGIINDFLGPKMPRHGYEAALLHDLPDRFEDNGAGSARPNARRALQSFFVKAGDELALQTASLLTDDEIVERTAESVRTRVAESSDDEAYRAIIQDGEDLPIKPEYWQIPAPSIDTDEMVEMFNIQGVNIESGQRKASESMDNLYRPNVHKPASQLKDIIEAEVFYAALCYATGQRGLAMGIRDAASNARFRNSGRDDLLVKARQAMVGLETLEEIELVFAKIFTGGGFLVSRVVDNASNTHDVLIGELNAQVGPDNLTGFWRRKSVGAHANKLEINGGVRLMDPLGKTLQTRDTESTLRTAKHYVEMIRSRGDVVQLAPSEKRTKPMVIKGDKEFLNMFTSDEEIAKIAHFVETRPGAYRGVKLTMFVTVERPNGNLQVPVETQIVTKEDIQNHEVGTASHLAYRGKVVQPTLVRNLGNLSERGERMITDPGTLTTASIARARTFISRVGSARN